MSVSYLHVHLVKNVSTLRDHTSVVYQNLVSLVTGGNTRVKSVKVSIRSKT